MTISHTPIYISIMYICLFLWLHAIHLLSLYVNMTICLNAMCVYINYVYKYIFITRGLQQLPLDKSNNMNRPITSRKLCNEHFLIMLQVNAKLVITYDRYGNHY